MPKLFEALKEYCEEYDLDRDSENTDRLRQIYWTTRQDNIKPDFHISNIVGLATRLTAVLDFRSEGGREFLRKRELAA